MPLRAASRKPSAVSEQPAMESEPRPASMDTGKVISVARTTVNDVSPTHGCCFTSHPGVKCLHDAWPGKNLCIFHLPTSEKDPATFWKHLGNYMVVLYEKAESTDTAEFASRGEAWVFAQRDQGMLARYTGTVADSKAWDFRGFNFPAMDGVYSLAGFVLGPASFRGSTFAGRADFHGARLAEADFSETRFGGVANFNAVVFGGRTLFWQALFAGDAYFNDAHFTGETKGRVNFVAARFTSMASFYGTRFSENMMFDFAEFHGYADFTRSRLEGVTRMSYVQVRDKMVFRGTQFSDAAVLLLWGLEFLPDTMTVMLPTQSKGYIVRSIGQVEFCDISKGMNQVSFLHTDVYSDRLYVRFRNVAWGRRATNFIYDARFTGDYWSAAMMPGAAPPEAIRTELDILFHLRERESQEGQAASRAGGQEVARSDLARLVRQDVERIAREIRVSSERFGSYSDAGNYYVGEMSYRLRRTPLLRPKKLALGLYWLVSNYGESPTRAAAWLLGIIVAATVVYPFTGFTFGASDGSKVLLTFRYVPADWWPTLVAFGKAFLFSLANLVPGYFRFQSLNAGDGVTTAVSMVQAVISVVVLALFLLAVRRRFSR